MAEEFTLDWKKRLNWTTDPFNTKVLDLVGNKKAKKKLNLFFLEKRTFGLIEAEEGVGKSSLIEWLREQLGKYKSEILTFELKKEKQQQEIIEKISKKIATPLELIKKTYKNFNYEQFAEYLRKNLGKKRLALLIDSPSNLSSETINLVKELYKEGLATIIIAGSKEELHKTGATFAKDQLNVKLKGLEYEEAKLMVKRRIEAVGGADIKPFTDKTLRSLWQQSNKNATTFLEKCRDKAVRLALEKKEEKLKETENLKELTTVELKKFVKQNLKEGFLRDDVEHLLREEGYRRIKVEQILDDIEDEIIREKLASEDKELEKSLS